MKLVTATKMRLSYPNLFQPSTGIEGATPKYSATFLVPKTDTALVQSISTKYQEAMALAMQPSGVWKGKQPPAPQLSYYDGDAPHPKSGEPWGDECKGHMILRTSSPNKPQCIDQYGQPVLEASTLYAGCYVRASITFKAYDTAGTKGIGSYLNAVMFVEDGEPFGEGGNAATDFAAYIQPQGMAPVPSAPAVPAMPVAPPAAPSLDIMPTQPVAAPAVPMAQPMAAVPGVPAAPAMPVAPFLT